MWYFMYINLSFRYFCTSHGSEKGEENHAKRWGAVSQYIYSKRERERSLTGVVKLNSFGTNCASSRSICRGSTCWFGHGFTACYRLCDLMIDVDRSLRCSLSNSCLGAYFVYDYSANARYNYSNSRPSCHKSQQCSFSYLWMLFIFLLLL